MYLAFFLPSKEMLRSFGIIQVGKNRLSISHGGPKKIDKEVFFVSGEVRVAGVGNKNCPEGSQVEL